MARFREYLNEFSAHRDANYRAWVAVEADLAEHGLYRHKTYSSFRVNKYNKKPCNIFLKPLDVKM